MKTLGSITWDFNSLRMQFLSEGKDTTLSGLKGRAIQVASKRQISRLTKDVGKGVLSMMLTESTFLQLELLPLSKDLDKDKKWDL